MDAGQDLRPVSWSQPPITSPRSHRNSCGKGGLTRSSFWTSRAPQSGGRSSRVHLRKRKCMPADYDLDLLARESEGYVGAEIEQTVIDAMYLAFNEETAPGHDRRYSCLHQESGSALDLPARNRCTAPDIPCGRSGCLCIPPGKPPGCPGLCKDHSA